MPDPSTMYRWRKMSDEKRDAVLEERRQHQKPWHSPPHYESDQTTYYLITAACYEHQHFVGRSPQRMAEFERDLVEVFREGAQSVFAWVVLPNHYHALVDTDAVKPLLRSLGQLHGRNSYAWNGEEDARGRSVWFNAAETAMKSERHYFATLNYVLNNAVHHRYVTKWADWPYSNASSYLNSMGREKALEIWQEFPVLDYGKDWDPPDL